MMNIMEQEIAFIVGNGISRKEINLNSLVGKGKIFGCNALYRDFDQWDYLVAIDDNMISELLQIRHKTTQQIIIPPLIERYELEEYRYSPRARSNAGMNAMLEAIRKGHKLLYCIGFDFLMNTDIVVQNMYDGSKNYGPETKTSIKDSYNRVRYLEWFAKKFFDVRFIFVLPDTSKTKTVVASNIRAMSTEKFLSKL